MLPNHADKSKTDYYTDRSFQSDGWQRWNDTAFTAFYSERYSWNLFSYGDFPYDTFVWPILLGSNRPISGSWMIPLQPPESFFQNITNAWVIDYPQLIPFSNLNNSTLNKLWPSFDWQEYSMLVNTGITHWDFIEIAFKRTNAEIATLNNQLANEHLATLANDATIAGGITGGVSVFLSLYLAWYVPRTRRKRRLNDRLSNWKSILASNENALKNPDYTLTELEIDGRPLDELATRYPDLAASLIDWRSRVRDLNNLVSWYSSFALMQGKYLQTRQRAKSRADVSSDVRSFAKDFVNLVIGGRRKTLLKDITKLLDILNQVMQDRGTA